MDNLFKTRVLCETVNKITPVKTRILDIVFGRKKLQISDLFAWDVVSGSETVLGNLKPGEPATIRAALGRKTVTCAGPRFAEKTFLAASDLNAIRAVGSQFAPELMSTRIAEEQTDMRAKMDRTREFMASKALAGQVVDAAGVVLCDYNFPAAQKPVLVGKNLWTDSESVVLKNIRAWKKLIGQAVNSVDKFIAFASSTAMDALLMNPGVQELLKYNSGSQIAEEGRIAQLAGVQIEEILSSYVDGNGLRQDFIPDGYLVLVGVSSENAGELFAPIVDLKDPNGVGSGNAASMFFSKSWEVEDPSGRWIKVEARPLPVLFKPECIVYAKVV
jgi:hypothetical protein